MCVCVYIYIYTKAYVCAPQILSNSKETNRLDVVRALRALGLFGGAFEPEKSP